MTPTHGDVNVRCLVSKVFDLFHDIIPADFSSTIEVDYVMI